MLFDDRLATVLRSSGLSEQSARTQYRQLLDLLGSIPRGEASELAEAAYQRLDELAEVLPQGIQSAILRSPGLRLRNRALVAWLARGEPQAAAAAMATARLNESDWLYLIPRLPMNARGFLRHRRDLPFSARQVLERLGVTDLVLPEPALERPAPAAYPAPAPPSPPVTKRPDPDAGIGALVRRIEAFQRARREGTAPRLPLEEVPALEADFSRRACAFDFATDAQGVLAWADPALAPLVVGMALGPERPGAVAVLDAPGVQAMARRVPLRGASITLAGPAEIAGEWRVDAAPFFGSATGHFSGYRGRLRRPALPREAPAPAAGEGGDRIRQLLHELRTPVNAIQGFAELIQQQMFGSAPNEYRALAAAVAVDAARLMAGFDEIDRLARLETGALRFDEGECDMREVMARIAKRLEGVLRPRSARIALAVEGSPFTVGMADGDAAQLAWRLLATLAGALAPGEIIDLSLASDGALLTVEAELPGALLDDGDLFAASAPGPSRAISAGMFGTGFTLRLARAEAEAAGGGLERRGDALCLSLPVLTAHRSAHTLGRQDNGGSTAA